VSDAGDTGQETAGAGAVGGLSGAELGLEELLFAAGLEAEDVDGKEEAEDSADESGECDGVAVMKAHVEEGEMLRGKKTRAVARRRQMRSKEGRARSA
jgi:hypothetical protein